MKKNNPHKGKALSNEYIKQRKAANILKQDPFDYILN